MSGGTGFPGAAQHDGWFFDLGDTLVEVADDEIFRGPDGRVRLLANVAETLRALKGRPVFVVTNQSGVATGWLTADEARGFIEQVRAATDGAIADYRICMHAKDAGCACRKPKPGMLLDLARAHGVEPARCALVGDAPVDQAAAEAAGFGAFYWAWEFFGRPKPG